MGYFVGAFIALFLCGNSLGWYLVLRKLKTLQTPAQPVQTTSVDKPSKDDRLAADLERQFANMMNYTGKPQVEND